MTRGEWTEKPEAACEMQPLPMTVVPDWDEQVQHAEEVCRLIDLHLDYESRGRMLRRPGDFRPEHLCPEQRVQVITDLGPQVIRPR